MATYRLALFSFLMGALIFGMAMSPIKYFHRTATPTVPAVKVKAAQVVQTNVPVYSTWIGSTVGYVDAQIRPKVQGYLLEQVYTNGSYVRSNQLLFKIDPRQFQAAYDQAVAQLHSAQASLEKSTIDVNRYTPLSKEGAVSAEELDQAIKDQLSSKASVDAANAAIEQAKLNLDWTQIYSPIDGISGISITQIGDLVSEASVLTTISQLDPIKIQFTLSEKEYLAHASVISLHADQLNRSPMRIRIILADGSLYPYVGSLSSIDRSVSQLMGTIKVQALFKNPGNILRPGQYTKVVAQVDTMINAILVPQRAVSELQGGHFVAVITSEDKVHIQPVTTGPQMKDLWVITSGLKAGDQVIVEGLQKVKDGTTVSKEMVTVPVPAMDITSLFSLQKNNNP